MTAWRTIPALCGNVTNANLRKMPPLAGFLLAYAVLQRINTESYKAASRSQ